MNDLFVIKALEKINLLMIIYTSSFGYLLILKGYLLIKPVQYYLPTYE